MLKIEEIKDILEAKALAEETAKARKGIDYYNGRHDIKDYRIFYYNADGKIVEDKERSNVKICHPFFTELVDQCTQYLLSGSDDYIKTDNQELQPLLNEYFDDSFKMELANLLTYTKVEGSSYLYRYVDKDGKSKFSFADAMNVTEVPAKYTSDNQDYVIYRYLYKRAKIDKKTVDEYRVQVWSNNDVTYYKMVGNDIKLDEEIAINPQPHILINKNGKKYGKSFNSIPFYRLDNNRSKVSDLFIVKDLIDDYDMMSCGITNNIEDFAEGIHMIKGYDGEMNLDELMHNVKVKKQIKVGDGGDYDVKTVDIPYKARQDKLELDEKNIYRFGMGFNSNQLGDGNVTNVVIKSRYALLDMKCNKLELQLKRMLNKVVQDVLDEINAEHDTGYTLNDIYYNFEREIITNEVDNANIEKIEADKKAVEINTLLSVATQLGNDTIVKAICDTLELDYNEVVKNIPPKPLDVLTGIESELDNE